MQANSLVQAAGVAVGTLMIAAAGFGAAMMVTPQQQDRGPVAVSDQARQQIAESAAQATAEAVASELMSNEQIQAAVKKGMIAFVKDRAGGGGAKHARNDRGGSPSTTAVPAVTEDDHVRGPKDAKYTLIEYSDYECPYCARLHKRVLPKLRERLGDDLRVVYRHRPLPMHEPQATKSALAAECVASMQGNKAFWQYTKALFDNPKRDALVETGRSLGVDGQALANCIDEKRHVARVQRDLDHAEKLGVRGTPTMFVRLTGEKESKRLNGAQPAARIEQVIKQLGS